jgi:hypothetical protein
MQKLVENKFKIRVEVRCKWLKLNLKLKDNQVEDGEMENFTKA